MIRIRVATGSHYCEFTCVHRRNNWKKKTWIVYVTWLSQLHLPLARRKSMKRYIAAEKSKNLKAKSRCIAITSSGVCNLQKKKNPSNYFDCVPFSEVFFFCRKFGHIFIANLKDSLFHELKISNLYNFERKLFSKNSERTQDLHVSYYFESKFWTKTFFFEKFWENMKFLRFR